VAQATLDAPRETCGVLVGPAGQPVRICPLPNVDPEPVGRYTADPQSLLNVLRNLDERGWEVVAIYHSHPRSPAWPSPTDRERAAAWPEVVYLIVSLAGGEPVLSAFWLGGGEEKLIPIEIDDRTGLTGGSTLPGNNRQTTQNNTRRS